MRKRSFLHWLALVSLVPCLVRANTLTVTNIADNSPGSLRQIIAIAANGDEIVFAPALAGQTISLYWGELYLNKSLTIRAPEPAGIILDGVGESRVLQVPAGNTVTLSGLTIRNGRFTLVTAIGGGPGGHPFDPLVPVGDFYGGGGIFNDGTLTLHNCTVTDNGVGYMFEIDANGGGIMNCGTLTLIGSTVSSNRADYGAGIYNTGTLLATNSTLSGNEAYVFGGGFHNWGSATLQSVTVAANLGHGFTASGGIVRYQNSLLASNTPANAATYGATLASDGWNVSSDATGNLLHPHDQPSVDAVIGPLADNGGMTRTHALLPGSPAYGGGIAFADPPQPGLDLDQRGQPRTAACRSQLDVGAYQHQPPAAMLDEGFPSGPFWITHAPVNLTSYGLPSGGVFSGPGVVAGVFHPLLAGAGSHVITYSVTDAFNCTGSVSQVWEVLTSHLTVQNHNDSGPGSLRQAIADSLPDGTIDFSPQIQGTISLTTGECQVSRSLTILGPGADVLRLSVQAWGRHFAVTDNARLEIQGLTLSDGRFDRGGSIFTRGDLRLVGCMLSNNIAYASGGAVGSDNRNRHWNFEGCTFVGNTAARGGALAAGIVVPPTTVSISQLARTTTYHDVNLNNTGTNVVFVAPGAAVTLAANWDSVYVDCPDCCPGCITQNYLGIDGNILECRYVPGGGNLYLTFDAPAAPGIYYVTQTATWWYWCYQFGNPDLQEDPGSAVAVVVVGDGQWATTTADLVNCTFAGNIAAGQGGAVDIGIGSTVHTLNCTIASNTATAGGGINSVAGGTFAPQNTIVAGNTAATGPDISDRLSSQGYNLIGRTAGVLGTFVVTDLLELNPRLGPLANNGGHTPTMLLDPSSPAINAGSVSSIGLPATDQRGGYYPRVVRDRVDIGAVEMEAVPPALYCPGYVSVEQTLVNGGMGTVSLAISNSWNSPIHVQWILNDHPLSDTNLPAGGGLASVTTLFSPGTNTLDVIADDSGPTAFCRVIVVVRDTIPPLITCPANLLVLLAPEQCGTNVGFEAIATDSCPCGTPTVFYSQNPGTTFNAGSNLVAVTAVDAAGNSNSCSFYVTARTAEPPQISCPTNIVTVIDLNGCDATVHFPPPVATAACGQAVQVVCSPPSGSHFPIGTNTVVCTATDAGGNTAACTFEVTVFDMPNQAWPLALNVTLTNNLGLMQAVVSQCLNTNDQSRWYRFRVQPGARVIVTLTDLAANFDLALFRDVADSYSNLTSLAQLTQLSAEFAADAFSPSAFSPSAFSPSAFSPSAFSPSAFSPSAFSPSAFSPSAFSPSAFSPSAFSPDAYSPSAFSPSAFSPSAFSPSAFSPSAFSPSAFSPSAFSPSAFSPSAFSPSAFSAAQSQSIIAVSAFDGTANEGVVVNTWNNSGDFYVRVRGRNGAFSPGNPYQLGVYMAAGDCGEVNAVPLDGSNQPLPAPTVAAPEGGYKTLILTDLDRMIGPGASPERTALEFKLAQLAARPEVEGYVLDVNQDSWVAYFNAQADTHFGCPFGKNLVAEGIRALVNRSRAGNALEYVVLVGNDKVIPFFRYPDEAMLGPEQNYVPPVRDNTASQASLRLGYVLSQDAYGSDCDIAQKGGKIPLQGLAVGRLIETPSEVMGMIEAYLGNPSGILPTPTNSFISGYDFLVDNAMAVSNELSLAIGTPPDTLISPTTLAPELCWNADDLRAGLYSKRHDVVFLAGHFSAGEALAADYATHYFAYELALTTNDFENTLIFSAGCHSGYNTVDSEVIPFVTLEPDWAQAAARKRATLIAGTGYQYGDTDFIEYSERLYLNFTEELRSGFGPVSVGKALKHAKTRYLVATPQLRGIHQKAYLQTTLYGLPMVRINMPGQRRAPDSSTPAIGSTTPAATDPGAVLGLTFADLTVTSTLQENTLLMTNTLDNSQVLATYYTGSGGTVNNPAEPVLPLEPRNVTVGGAVLRGVGFRGGAYTDHANKIPLTGAATTEIRGVHATFLSSVFYPVRPWNVNYFGSLCADSTAGTQLMAIPAQFKSDSPGAATGTLRTFGTMEFRLFYSANIVTYSNEFGLSTPALAAPPAISSVTGTTDPGSNSVTVAATVVGNPSAGIHEVWVTFTALSGPSAGTWQSLNLTQSVANTMLWQATVPLNGTTPRDLRFILQAANGVGAVSMDTKLGAYYAPDAHEDAAPAQLQATTIDFLSPPTSANYRENASFTARLREAGAPLAGQQVVFSLSDQQRWAFTDASGLASVNLQVSSLPGSNTVNVSFSGADGLAPSSATTPFTILKQGALVSLSPSTVYAKSNLNSSIVAKLVDSSANAINERTVFLIVKGPTGSHSRAVITDGAGRAPLGIVPLPDGRYTVDAYFNGFVPLPSQTLTLGDAFYFPASTTNGGSATLVIDNNPPTVSCGSPIAFECAGPGTTTTNLTAWVQDVDGTPLTVVWTVNGVPVQTNSLAANSATSPTAVILTHSFSTGANAVVVSVSDDLVPPLTCAQTVTVLNPAAPVVDFIALATAQDTPAVIPLDKLLASVFSPADRPITLTGLGTATHGSVVLNGGTITYTPEPGYLGSDSFNYTVSDGCGDATGTILVTVDPASLPSGNHVGLLLTPGGKLVVFAGIPGRQYLIQWADDPLGPWTDLAPPLTADALGVVQFMDTTQPPPPIRFYRTVAP